MKIFYSEVAKRRYSIVVVLCMAAFMYTFAIFCSNTTEAINTLDRLESENYRARQEIPHFNVGEGPSEIAANGYENKIYVSNWDSKSVSVIDADTLKVTNVKVGSNPDGIAIDDFSNKIYVANYASNSISVIDGDTLKVTNVRVGQFPTGIAVDFFHKKAYVSNPESNTVSIINSRSLEVKNVTVGLNPSDITIDIFGGIAYVANTDSDTVSIINGTDYKNIANVPVGDKPETISFDEKHKIVYVANTDSDTVSIINGTDYKNIANVPVGDRPKSIAVDEKHKIVYVANTDSDTVSIINGTDYKNIANVPVGDNPIRIVVSEEYNIVYVANSGSKSISIINGTNIANVPVGDSPVSVAIDDGDGILYIANFQDTVSVISSTNQQLQAGVSFDSNPFHAGHIECITSTGEKLTVPTNQYLYVNFGTKCTAEANQGYQFNSWVEHLGRNSSRTLSASTSSNTPLDWFMNTLGWLTSIFSGGPKATAATLSVNAFGNFTANFEKSPPPIPAEYLATLFAVVISAFIGSWLTPTVIDWRRAKKQGGLLDRYHIRVKNLFDDGRLDSKDIAVLNSIRSDIADEYSRGRITREQFEILANEISVSYREIFVKGVNSLDSLSDDRKEKLLHKLNNDISEAYARGRINDLHYTLLKEGLKSYEKK